MLLAYTISNIYQRHKARSRKAKLDDSEVVGHDETLLFIVVALYAERADHVSDAHGRRHRVPPAERRVGRVRARVGRGEPRRFVRVRHGLHQPRVRNPDQAGDEPVLAGVHDGLLRSSCSSAPDSTPSSSPCTTACTPSRGSSTTRLSSGRTPCGRPSANPACSRRSTSSSWSPRRSPYSYPWVCSARSGTPCCPSRRSRRSAKRRTSRIKAAIF